MKKSRNNNVNISGDLNNSTIEVSQNQDAYQPINEKNIEYEVDENSYSVVSVKPAEKASQIFNITIFISALAILSDIIGLISYLGLNKGIIVLIFAPLALFMTLFTSHQRWVLGLPTDIAKHKGGWWYEKLENDEIAVYLKKAKCIYPKCNGVVHIVPAPPRERPNHTLVGRCSHGDVQHTYSVDFNGIGYPRKFDWRSLPTEKE